jgi:hypothetical protein
VFAGVFADGWTVAAAGVGLELPAYGAASGSLRIDAERFVVMRAQVAPANRSVVPAA